MQGKDNRLDFSGQEIYVGLDTGKKSWKVTILTKDFEHKTFTQPPRTEALVGYLRKHFPGAKYLCAYYYNDGSRDIVMWLRYPSRETTKCLIGGAR